MSRKSQLLPYHLVSAGDMSTASITSAATNIQYQDNVGIQCNFTGSPVGTLSVQISADHVQDAQGNISVAGSWAAFATSSVAGGSPVYFDLTQVSAPWVRLVYTKTSGTGTLDVYITGKQL